MRFKIIREQLDDEYYCTKCDASLNNQEGFSTNLAVWRCEKCEHMMSEDKLNYDKVIWFCDNCDAV